RKPCGRRGRPTEHVSPTRACTDGASGSSTCVPATPSGWATASIPSGSTRTPSSWSASEKGGRGERPRRSTRLLAVLGSGRGRDLTRTGPDRVHDRTEVAGVFGGARRHVLCSGSNGVRVGGGD